MVVKKKATKSAAAKKAMADRGTFQSGSLGSAIPAAVVGQLEPLDRVARAKTMRWGDTLPSLVSPELAGRFRGAYEALGEAVVAEDVVKVNKVATALIRAWTVLEDEAMASGHDPLPENSYCVDLGGGKVTCIALSGVAQIRKKNPSWVVYSFEDAARVISASFTEAFLKDAFAAFPEAKVTRVTGQNIDKDLEDEIPW